MLLAESRVETVTLYHQGATVRRVVDLPCPGGKPPAQVEVVRLPLSLFDPTVRVRVELPGAAAASQVVATHVRVGLFVPPRDAPTQTASQAELRGLRQAVALKRDALEQVRAELALLRVIPTPARAEAEEGTCPPPSPMAACVVLEQFVHDGVQARVVESRALAEELEKIELDLQRKEREVELASTAHQVRPQELTKSVQAQLRHDGPPVERARLVLDYFVPGARWAPAYQCRMSRDCRRAEIQVRALVCQHSGEDWRGVNLELSTASPMTWTELPELSSIRIGKAQPPPPAKRGFRPPPQGALALYGDHDRDQQRARGLLPAPSTWDAPTIDVPSPPDFSLPEPAAASRGDDEGHLYRKRGRRMEAEAEEDSFVEAARCAEEPEPMSEGLAPCPPPPPPAASMPRSLGAGVMAQPAPSMRARAAAPSPKGAARPLSEAKPRPSVAAMEVMVFTQLRLGSAGDGATRGKLLPLDTRRGYLESLERLGVSVSLDVMAVVAEAEHRAAAVASLPLPTGAVDVRAVAGHFDYTYRADAAVDVPSDGTFHSVALGDRTAESDVVYVVVPREDPNVFRQASIKNPLAAPLVAGPAEVYVGGEYVLSTQLPTVPARGEFRLGLGVEQAVKCARNTRFKEQRSGTKIVATAELIHDITVDLSNNLEREIQCEVRERIPQPAENAEVVVEEGKVHPAWETYKQEERGRPVEGGRRWRVKVGAGKKERLEAQYVVKLYANNEVVGGNRREA
jgi:hypothetical protein